MMMKMQSWNLRFGNKGIVFSLDAAAALIIVLFILIVSNFYMYRSVNELPNLEVIRTGHDIIAMMDYEGTLETLNANSIKTRMDALLPGKYDMLLKTTSENQNISIGGTPPNDRFIGAGKRFSVVSNQENATYLTTRFWIWLK